MSNKPTATAADIKKALAEKHHKDYFLTEVKSGSTWEARNLRILDGVAVRRSWTNPYITGYEVKVTRSDFTGDSKFYTYLPLVHALYIATPTGLVKREELPTEIGLIWYDPEKKTLTVKKRPPPRKIEISRDLLLYIIYSRLESDRLPFYSSTAEYFRDWLENKRSNEQLGQAVGGKLLAEIRRLESELRAADRFQRGEEREQYNRLMKCLTQHGMYEWERDPVKWLAGKLIRSYPEALDDVGQIIDQAARTIQRAKETAERDREQSEGGNASDQIQG